MFGNGSYGQLGTRNTENTSRPTLIDENMKLVSCGGLFTGIINDDDSLYMFGTTEHGQTGAEAQEGEDGELNPTLIPNPVLPGEKIKYISCGGAHSGVINNKGELYMFGNNEEGELGTGDYEDKHIPIKISDFEPLLGKKIKKVSCGADFTAILTTKNKLYMCGMNIYGQFGYPPTQGSNIPVRVFTKLNIKDVICGYSHMAIITTNNILYMVGDNSHGQLGNNKQTDRTGINYKPVKIDIKGIKMVSCGSETTGIITRNNELYMCGRNQNGQLGTGDKRSRYVFTRIAFPIERPYKIEMISCGISDENNTAVIIVKDGKRMLFTFGDNWYGQCGISPRGEEIFENILMERGIGIDDDDAHEEAYDEAKERGKILVPTKINIDNPRYVSCGYGHTGVLCS